MHIDKITIYLMLDGIINSWLYFSFHVLFIFRCSVPTSLTSCQFSAWKALRITKISSFELFDDSIQTI
ncbi:unnamed protein product, partial [Acanthoscelides obtectus]